MSVSEFLRRRAVEVSVSGSYSLPRWYDCEGQLRTFACRTKRVSPFRMIVDVPVVGKVGERVTSYFQDFGEFQCTISATLKAGFLMELEMTRGRRAWSGGCTRPRTATAAGTLATALLILPLPSASPSARRRIRINRRGWRRHKPCGSRRCNEPMISARRPEKLIECQPSQSWNTGILNQQQRQRRDHRCDRQRTRERRATTRRDAFRMAQQPVHIESQSKPNCCTDAEQQARQLRRLFIE